MKRTRSWALASALACMVVLLTGCEERYFKSRGVVSSDGGQLAAWSRPVQGCSPDPLPNPLSSQPAGEPAGKSSTLFTLYWDNPAHRVGDPRPDPPGQNKLKSLQILRGPAGLTGVLKTTRIDSGTDLDGKVCSKLNATTAPAKPVIAGGRPTVDGTLDLDCRVAGSHLTASVRFTGCEY